VSTTANLRNLRNIGYLPYERGVEPAKQAHFLLAPKRPDRPEVPPT